MGRNLEEFKRKREYICKQIDGVSYIRSLIKVKKIGNIFSALCPFHSEKTESLRIYPEGHKNDDGTQQEHTSWYCFGCKKGGDLVKFEELYFDLDTASDACDSLQAKFNINYSESDQESALRISLTKEKQEQVKIMSLKEINFVCSIVCRNYLQYVNNNFPNKFDEEYEFIQDVYKKLDHELLERNAQEAKNLIKITENTIKSRKNSLTNEK